MVRVGLSLLARPVKSALSNITAKKPPKFQDKIRLHVRGGAGGQGLPSYGGCGGRGGHVYVVGHGDDKQSLKNTLKRIPDRRLKGTTGGNSTKRKLLGEPGKDVTLETCRGVTIRTDEGKILGDINEVGDRVLVARGGAGGSPQSNFHGLRGEAHSITLDLKLIADIGLVGFPNAGKSTLLRAISRAKPKVGEYAFTTIHPNIGTMVFEDERRITMADLPGLIEGAHINKGMGHSFLKHVERTKVLLFLVDIHGFRLNPNYPVRSPVETILLLNRELELYKEELLNKPTVLVLNKIDIGDTESKVKELIDDVQHLEDNMHVLHSDLHPQNLVKFDEIIPISGKENVNIDFLKDRLRQLLDVYADIEYENQHSSSQVIEDRKSKLTENFDDPRGTFV